jgi:cobalt-zinc-cadmium resistance protein CzcA
MIARILSLSIRSRYVVVLATLLVAAFGVVNLVRLPIDAVPDITNKQVQINTSASELGPLEIERRVTFPVETALAGIPGLEGTRSISRNGFSQVTAVFTEGTDIYFARQQVTERLAQSRDTLPEGVQPTIGPITTGLGDIFMWTVEFAERDPAAGASNDGKPGWQSNGDFLTSAGERLTDDVSRGAYLRTVQDWIIRPQMRAVRNVAGIDSIGGFEKQYVVEPDPAKLAAFGVSFSELAQALEAANLSVGANFLQRGGESFLIRADARVRTLDEIRRAVVANREGVRVAVQDLADVKVGGDLRTGAATKNGEEVVIGTAFMLTGANSRTVASDVGARLAEVAKSLPPGVEANVAYDRSRLVAATIGTVEKNLAEGALFVIVILFLMLGNIRAALITALVIPLSMLMAAIGMNELGVSGNLMSLGALDFGLIVDGAVIIVENCLRRLAERQHHEGRLLTLGERLFEVTEASKEMIQPTVFGQAIIFLVYAPLLAFSGVEGKLFSPMAITVMLALAGAFILSLTFVPAMIAILIRGKVAEKDVVVVRVTRERYATMLRAAVKAPLVVIGAGAAIFAVAAFLFTTLGQEFTPQLDEKDLAVQALRIPSTSLDQSVDMQKRVEHAIMALPEVERVMSKTGTAEVAADPMPVNISDGFVIVKPKEEWPDRSLTKDELVARIEAAISGEVGNAFEFSQPIELRFNELISGVRSDVAVKLYGDDLEALEPVARQIAAALQGIGGAADVKVEQTQGFPVLDVRFDRDAVAGHGLTIEEVADTVAASLGGREAGLVFEGDQRFEIVVRATDAVRNNVDAIGALPVMLPVVDGQPRLSVPLRSLAEFSFTEGLNQISRENGKRRIVIQANIRGRDLGGFVSEAQASVARVALPPGVYTEWGGQFENLQAAQARLSIVVPICFVLILVLLYMALGGLVPALAVFSAVPLALAGGVFALVLRGLPFSISAAVGFIALSGIAVLNGLVMMTSIRKRIDAGIPLEEAITGGAIERYRPILMTALVAAIGFVPMAIATETGAEVQRPLATVVIGGLVTATALTLFVLPAICKLVLRRGPATSRQSSGEAALRPAE